MAAMRLTRWEEDRLLIFSAAELARRHLAAGLPMNAPEAVALICDAMLEAARAGAGYAEVEAAGIAAVSQAQVMAGVRELIDDVRLEVMLGDGTRLIVLVDPLGGGEPAVEDGPGAIRPAAADAGTTGSDGAEQRSPGRDAIELTVRSKSRRLIRVSSHYPFHKVNPRLVFDREAAHGFRLDLPAGASERWAPGEIRTVRLVRYGGTAGAGGPGTVGETPR
jgi:urease subunit gamma/beta